MSQTFPVYSISGLKSNVHFRQGLQISLHLISTFSGAICALISGGANEGFQEANCIDLIKVRGGTAFNIIVPSSHGSSL